MRWELEELARIAIERADEPIPIRPGRLARKLGLEVHTSPGCEGLLIGQRIIVDDGLRPERRAFAIAHELGHHLLRKAGLETPGRNDEDGANYLGASLLLPRDDFERDLRRWGWDLLQLKARHRFASFEALARRIVSLRDARAFIFDRPVDGRPKSYSVPAGLRPTEHELLAMEEAIACGAPVEPITGVTGWPVIEHAWIRVVTVAAV